jgi:hypothetical protein
MVSYLLFAWASRVEALGSKRCVVLWAACEEAAAGRAASSGASELLN